MSLNMLFVGWICRELAQLARFLTCTLKKSHRIAPRLLRRRGAEAVILQPYQLFMCSRIEVWNGRQQPWLVFQACWDDMCRYRINKKLQRYLSSAGLVLWAQMFWRGFWEISLRRSTQKSVHLAEGETCFVKNKQKRAF